MKTTTKRTTKPAKKPTKKKYTETTYIDAIDRTCEPVGPGVFRKVSLGMNEKHPETLLLLGNLPHCTEITFNKQNALKLIDWLRKLHNIESVKEKLLKIARTAGSLREAYNDDKESLEYSHSKEIVDQINNIIKSID